EHSVYPPARLPQAGHHRSRRTGCGVGDCHNVNREEAEMPKIMKPHDADFERVTALFREFGEQESLTLGTLGADQYGTYVWKAGARDTLNRYITVAVTPIAD